MNPEPLSRWKTLSRNDPEFATYLDGSFSKSFLAMPVRSLNVGSFSEQVTFEIIEAGSLPRPDGVAAARQLIRPSSLVFSIGPMIATLFYCVSHGLAADRFIGVTAFLGVVLFHIAVNLFNDYGDHMKGQDRLRPHGGSRAIQKGWVRAATVRRTAWVFLAAAALCGLPAVLLSVSRVAIVAGLALLVALEFAFQKMRLKARGWAEILAFLLTGPLLTIGYSWAICGRATFEEVVFGCVFGAIALLYFHSANFENIMVDKQAGASTWATRAGFDASKRFYYFAATLPVLFILSEVVFGGGAVLVCVALAAAMLLLPASLRVRGLASPLSSRLSGLRAEAVRVGTFTTLAYVSAFLYVLARG